MKSDQTFSKSNKSTNYSVFYRILLIAGVSSISACQMINKHDVAPEDYVIRDSLYVISDEFHQDINDDSKVIEYQSISAIENSIPKSDVELIFDAMVNNELVGIDPIASSSEAEPVKLPESDVNAKDETFSEANIPDSSAAINVINTQTQQANQSSLAVELPEHKKTPPEAQFEEQSNDQQIAEINRLTASAPSAAGIPVETVLPEVEKEVAEANLPNEIYLLARASEYHPSQFEFGMWQIAKQKGSFNEQCTLRSATLQVEAGEYSAQVWFDVIGNELLVNSTTNIDINKPKVGVKVDNGELQAFRKKLFQTSAVWSGQLNDVLIGNQQLSVTLGGDELGRRTPEFAIGLKDLKKAYAEYSKCNQGVRFGSL